MATLCRYLQLLALLRLARLFTNVENDFENDPIIYLVDKSAWQKTTNGCPSRAPRVTVLLFCSICVVASAERWRRLDVRVRLFDADGVTSPAVGQLAPPTEQQQQQHGEPLPQGDITINARSPASTAGLAERNHGGKRVVAADRWDIIY